MQDFLGQELEIGLIKVLAPFVQCRYFLDIGAEKGAFAAVMFALGMRGAMFEPMARHHHGLQGLAAANGSLFHPYAIDEWDGERELFIASDDTGNELDYFHSLHKLEAETRFHHVRSVPVACRSLQSLVVDGTIPRKIGILKTDTEGNDLYVLKGLGEMRPELIICEYFTEGLYSGWESAHPDLAIDLLRRMGYSRYIATKRIGEFEYCTPAPTGFLPRQWGNLFFLCDRLHADAEPRIGRFLTDAESRLMAGVQAISADRVAKEAVIRELVAALPGAAS